MQIIPIIDEHRHWLADMLRGEWGGPLMVSAGRLFDASACEGFLAVEDGETLGYALYEAQGERCELTVLGSFREGRGVASRLIDAVKAAARARGCRRLWLSTTNDNAHAMRFYLHRGFALIDVIPYALNDARALKPQIPPIGMDEIPLLHEFIFAIEL